MRATLREIKQGNAAPGAGQPHRRLNTMNTNPPLPEPPAKENGRAADGPLQELCSAPIAQAMLRYWDIAAHMKDLRAEQKLVGEQWEDLFHTLAETNVNDWLDWAFGGSTQEKVRKEWESKNPRFRLTRRGVEVRPNEKGQR